MYSIIRCSERPEMDTRHIRIGGTRTQVRVLGCSRTPSYTTNVAMGGGGTYGGQNPLYRWAAHVRGSLR